MHYKTIVLELFQDLNPAAVRATKKGFLHAEDPWSADQTGVSCWIEQ